MSKVKINLASGVSLEKPLINAFKSEENCYVILDNEMNGSMGLPIILVCKLIGNKLTKIIDQNEWTQVKELLKQIIAGNKLEYVNIGLSLNADDIYYTQLTLPVPSFDALRSAYAPVSVENAPVEEVSGQPENTVANTSIMPDVNVPSEAPVSPVVPPVEPISPAQVAPAVSPEIPVMPNIGDESVMPMDLNMNQITNPEPVVNADINQIPVTPEIPVMPTMPTMEPVNNTMEVEEPVITEPVSPVVPQVNSVEQVMPVPPVQEMSPVMPEIPVVSEEPVNAINNIFDEEALKGQKEAFIEACSNMFDALVEQFKKQSKSE